MNHKETIKQIQKLVPSIMALEFGCVVETNIFPSYPCHFRLCYKTWKSDILVCENNKEGQALLSMNDCEILGKPITLATVLLAIGTTEYANKVGCDANGDMVKIETYEDRTRTRADWDLSKDNFNDQSEETKTFIGGLLGN